MFLILIAAFLYGFVLSNEEWHFTGINVALNKVTTQSPITTAGGESWRAVDGRRDAEWNKHSCSHAYDTVFSTLFWSVDLNGSYMIKGIRIYNQDDWREWLDNFQIIGYPTKTTLYDDSTVPNKQAQQLIISIPVNITSTFSNITIKIPAREGNSILSLCEVEIYEDIKCKAPSSVTNGHYIRVSNKSYSVGDSLTWTCSEGFKSDQNKTRQCFSPSEWSGADPNCSLITCAFPVNLYNVSLTFSNGSTYQSGIVRSTSYVGVHCQEGFRTNVTSITCTLDGEWNTLPTCSQITCNRLGILLNGTLLTFANGSTYESGTVPSRSDIGVHCQKGFRTNVTSITCSLDGEWSTLPTCLQITCDRLGMLLNGTYTYMYNNATMANHTEVKFVYGTIAEPNCNDAFTYKGERRVCGKDGNWSGVEGTCESETRAKPPLFPMAAVEGIIAGCIGLAAVVAVIIMVYLCRRMYAEKQASDPHIPQRETPGQSNLVDEESVAENNAPEVGLERTSLEDDTDYSRFNEEVSERAIKVEDFMNVVLNQDTAPDRFSTEFKSFPSGMTQPHTQALENKTRNRYRMLYAYDETRVVLDVWDADTDTDYINACFINGYQQPKAYIASQGPVAKTVGDFWRMIWQLQTGKVVMLTNTYEEDTMKCFQYWPIHVHGTEDYGQLRVTLEATDTFSSFVIRTLLVEKNGESPRRVKQFHFTSWPDKDVPAFCSSLVHFRSKVNAANVETKGPIVVHCSAGIGRTGTYIAIDFLTDQGLAVGYVDVAGCVETLRHQRVNMVQKKEQYEFVHQALNEILVSQTSVVPSAGFQTSYKKLMESENGTRRIEKEFDMFRKLSPKAEKRNGLVAESHLEKNRFVDICPDEEYMPSLSQPGRELDNKYINAAFLPMYRDENALIITQTPLETTIVDFWNLVFHQQVHTIVMMNHVTQIKKNEVYWPDVKQTVTQGDITIYNSGTGMKSSHSVVHMTLSRAGKERAIVLIQFGNWTAGNLLPDDPEHVLSALELVERNQRQTGNHPVVVHCMDGVERSGLFCVIAATLDRTKIEQDVAISQVMQEMRSRRHNVIPNVEQFVFCHEVVLKFLQQYEAYSNFAFRE